MHSAPSLFRLARNGLIHNSGSAALPGFGPSRRMRLGQCSEFLSDCCLYMFLHGFGRLVSLVKV